MIRRSKLQRTLWLIILGMLLLLNLNNVFNDVLPGERLFAGLTVILYSTLICALYKPAWSSALSARFKRNSTIAYGASWVSLGVYLWISQSMSWWYSVGAVVLGLLFIGTASMNTNQQAPATLANVSAKELKLWKVVLPILVLADLGCIILIISLNPTNWWVLSIYLGLSTILAGRTARQSLANLHTLPHINAATPATLTTLKWGLVIVPATAIFMIATGLWIMLYSISNIG